MNRQSIIWEMILGDNIVNKRFGNKKELKAELERLLNKKIKLENATNKDNNNLDYELLCGIETSDNYYYITIYYLKTRNKSLYITEVSVDNE